MIITFPSQKFIIIGLTLMAGLLLILYLWQVNIIIGKAYIRNSLIEEVEKLQHTVKKTDLVLSTTESLEALEDRLRGLQSFEPVSKVRYIRMLGSVVVRSDDHTPK